MERIQAFGKDGGWFKSCGSSLCSSWGAFNRRLGTSSFSGVSQGLCRNPSSFESGSGWALGKTSRQVLGQHQPSVSPVAAAALLGDLALSLQRKPCEPGNIIRVPMDWVWPCVGASLTSSRCILQPPHEAAVFIPGGRWGKGSESWHHWPKEWGGQWD